LAREARGSDPSGELYEKEERDEREREGGDDGEEERGCARMMVASGGRRRKGRDAARGFRKVEEIQLPLQGGEDTGTPVTSPSWSSQWGSRTLGRIAVGCRPAVCQGEKGV